MCLPIPSVAPVMRMVLVVDVNGEERDEDIRADCHNHMMDADMDLFFIYEMYKMESYTYVAYVTCN